MADPRSSRVDPARLTPVLACIAIVVLALSLATVAPPMAALVVGAAAGCIGGYAVALSRTKRGLGASLTSEREPASAGTINIASIPVIGVGGLGLVAMAAFVAWFLPRGQELVMFAIVGGAAGAAASLAWRRARGASPFDEDAGETLHLR